MSLWLYDGARVPSLPSPRLTRAKSGAERKAAMVSRHNEIGEIPAIRHHRLRESCRYDLERFGWYYCRSLLDHRASETIKDRLISKMQEAVLHGGQLAVEFTRGAGKTTWTEIAFVWAILYGHRRFPVCIAASRTLAKSIKSAVYSILETSPAIAADFPAISLPLRKIGGVVQRAASLTYQGRPIEFDSSEMSFRLPTLRDDSGNLLDHGCGANFACRGAGASVRGLNELGSRPDFILFDDPQTQKDASSATSIERLDRFIHGDALNLAANTTTMAAFLTITPQKFGDLAHRIADKNLHPNWSVSICPFLPSLCPDFEELAAEFVDAYNRDAAADDFSRSISCAWYKENAHRFAGTVPVDPLAFDKGSEIDAIHHALNKIAAIGKDAFAAEYQMQVASSGEGIDINPKLVSAALNGSPAYTLPPGITSAVAFVDVNIQKGTGLSWVIGGFGRGRVAAVIAYGRYPETGELCPKKASDLTKARAVGSAITYLVGKFAALRLRTSTGKTVQLSAVGFDRGYLPEVVCRTLHVLRKRQALPYQLCAVRGFGWQRYDQKSRNVIARGDHCDVRRSDLGEFLAVQTAYWREIAQSGLVETPLMPGSLSLYGSDPLTHWDFANEVCAERLVRKYLHPSGQLAWEWSPPMGPNHYGDCLTNVFALGSWFRLYDALPKVLDTTARLPDATLFNPLKNPAINADRAAMEKELEEFHRQKLPPKPAAVRKKGSIKWRKV